MDPVHTKPPTECPRHPGHLVYLRTAETWACVAAGCGFDIWQAPDGSWVTTDTSQLRPSIPKMSEQRQFAEALTYELAVSGHDDLFAEDILDALAVAGLKLALDHSGEPAVAYIKTIQDGREVT